MTKPEYSWIKYKDQSLEFTRKEAPDFEEWEAAMAALNMLYESGGFFRGDLYIAGERWFGEEKAVSIFDPLTWAVQTWQNSAWVCRQIEPSRRREQLSFSHHAEVSALDPELQDQYLQTAIDTQLSVRKLRVLIQDEQGHVKKVGPLDQFLYDEAEKIRNRLEEAEGIVKEKMVTAIFALDDAAEVQKDSEAMPQHKEVIA